MAAFINTNTASLNAQRNLSASQSNLTTSLQRLSSGLRINSAKDDAAGLAIASRFTSQIRGTDQAVRNANDGISLAQTAEGSLGEITNNLQRIRELAVQASNSTNSASDRAAIDQEVQQRLSEIDRNASQTSFNGQKILDGSFGSANFQIGANVGETIGINLDTGSSMRTSSIGAVATATTANTLGATGTGGATSVAASAFNFGQVGSDATSGSVSFTPTTLTYGTDTSVGSNGTISFTPAAFEFQSGTNDSVTLVDNGAELAADFSTDISQFDVKVGSQTVGITLTADYTDADGVAAEIQAQIQAVSGLENVTVSADNVSGELVFDNVDGADAVEILNADANAVLHGIADDAGTAGAANPSASFTVDNTTVTLTSDLTDADGLAAEIGTQLGTGYTVTNNAGVLTIDNETNGGAAVAITNANASAVASGIANNLVGTAGVAGTTSNEAQFNIGGIAITLDQDFASMTALKDNIAAQLVAGGGAFDVTMDGAAIKVTRQTEGAGSLGVAITGADAEAVTAGITNVAGNPGSDEVLSTAASFKVDGQTVTLDDDYTNAAGLRAALTSQLSGYTVGGTGNAITITNNTTGSDAVTISDADPTAYNSGFVNGSGTAGTTSGSIVVADLKITGNSGKAIDVSGTYDTADKLAEAINKSVSGVNATIVDNKLTLTSSGDMKLEGASRSALGFASDTVAANSGSLSTASTKTVEGALATIQSIDSALASVSTLRSTFGAIQNRFESVISNLSSTSENLSSARSRIQDADFAQETAALTRGQILQQAGTAMLAQANGLPNGVLALLRG